MIRAKFYLDTRSEKKDGSYPIKINITRNRKTFFVNTGISSIKDHWEGNQCSNKEFNFRAKNVRLRDMMNKVEKVIFDLGEAGKESSTTDKQLKNLIESKLFGEDSSEMTFADYLEKFMATKIREGTIKVYVNTLNKIREFDESATFNTINKDWLIEFENWMVRSGCKTNTISIHLRNIRAVFNYAIDNEYTTLYPFRRFKIKKEETAKRSLSVEELRKLRDCRVEEYQEKYRDILN